MSLTPLRDRGLRLEVHTREGNPYKMSDLRKVGTANGSHGQPPAAAYLCRSRMRLLAQPSDSCLILYLAALLPCRLLPARRPPSLCCTLRAPAQPTQRPSRCLWPCHSQHWAARGSSAWSCKVRAWCLVSSKIDMPSVGMPWCVRFSGAGGWAGCTCVSLATPLTWACVSAAS